MAITCRKYNHVNDYKGVCEFLEETYSAYGTRFNNNITLFEFQCALSRGKEGNLKNLHEIFNNIFLCFDEDKLVGILMDENVCLAADYRYIFKDIVDVNNESMEYEIFEGDNDFENVLESKGYYKTEEYYVLRDMDCNSIVDVPNLPEGFYVKLVSDLNQHDRVYKAYKLCYGILFNKIIFKNFYETSTYRKELDIVIMSPDDEVVALCSGRYDEKNKMVSIEAVSCYPEYRKKGISKAMILYVINEAKKLGADKVTVLTAMPEKYPAPNRLYESAGFKIVGKLYTWKKRTE
ncbi:GNAT family N-acetyltransferase [Clostridium sp. UBA6640]|uniref:GNAT family N-acetyltransferase n=1 Tax=Clostridium sp. UBA6640 TaxID=1946370 RepID=UPI0025C39DDA|nr:GNAT family N-acetyltransferase [Clostridium sp. UBA6640]